MNDYIVLLLDAVGEVASSYQTRASRFDVIFHSGMFYDMVKYCRAEIVRCVIVRLDDGKYMSRAL